jgi:hypothetical protein
MSQHRLRVRLIVLAGLALAGLGLGSIRNAGAATLGFVEEFGGAPSVSGWSSQATLTNPGTGGVGGNGDGFLTIARSVAGNLGAFSTNAAYQGDWTLAGITQIRLWLDDVGADQALEMHVSVGSGANLWQYNTGFLPPNGSWGEFEVDLSLSSAFTQIIGAPLTFAQALSAADRILVRHDTPPFGMTPNTIAGDVGLDHILLTNGIVGVGSSAPIVLHPVELAAPYPNPSRGPVTFSVVQTEPAEIHLQIVDVSGRLVRSHTLPAGAGQRLWLWDGGDDRGNRVAAGVYRVRAFGPNGGTTRSLVRIN